MNNAAYIVNVIAYLTHPKIQMFLSNFILNWQNNTQTQLRFISIVKYSNLSLQ